MKEGDELDDYSGEPDLWNRYLFLYTNNINRA